MMDNESGVTRDRHYGHAEWTGVHFTVVDTGGYVVGSEDKFEGAIREQVQIALEESALVLFMVDVDTGLLGLDEEFAQVLRKSKRQVLLVANKSDTFERRHLASEFYALGMGDPIPVSAQNGSGTGELLDEVVRHLPASDEEDPDAGVPRIAILGRPNVGKSSFVNALIGQPRNIVTEVAGTTRDAINTRYKAYGKDFILTDTAGLRRKSRVHDNIEFYSVMRSLRALEDANVCVVMLDATRGIEAQDVTIVFLAARRRKGIVILVNKWDAVEKDDRTYLEFERAIRERLAPMGWIPIVFISALTKQRVFQAVEKTIEVYENLSKRVPTSQLNDKLLPDIQRNPPPASRGRYVNIKYITQLPTRTPSFAFFCNLPKEVNEPYARYVENRLREYFDFEGVPINIFFRKK
ncbi:MAG: ribosome biogenesis GTPase Der [Catalinimonas sp.]